MCFGFYGENFLLTLNERLGQVLTAGDGRVQQYRAVQHRDQPIHDVSRLREGFPLTSFYPEYDGKKTAPQTYVHDVIEIH